MKDHQLFLNQFLRNRSRNLSDRDMGHANQLRKQYYEKRDDSDTLKLDTVDED